MLGLNGGRDLPRSSITAVNYKPTSQLGSTSYYVLSLRSNGKDITVASGLKYDDAKWIADDLGMALDVEAKHLAGTTFGSPA